MEIRKVSYKGLVISVSSIVIGFTVWNISVVFWRRNEELNK